MKLIMEQWRGFLEEAFDQSVPDSVAQDRDLEDLLNFSYSANKDQRISNIIRKTKIQHKWSSTKLRHAADAGGWAGLEKTKLPAPLNSTRVIYYHTQAWEELVYEIHKIYLKEVIEKNLLNISQYEKLLKAFAIIKFSTLVIHELAHHEDPSHIVSTKTLGPHVDLLDKKSYDKISKIVKADPDYLESVEAYAYGLESQYLDHLKKSNFPKSYIVGLLPEGKEEVKRFALLQLDRMLNNPDYQVSDSAAGSIQSYFPEFDEGGN